MARTDEWMPSAPTSRSAVHSVPSVSVADTLAPSCRIALTVTPRRTVAPDARVASERIRCSTGRMMPPPFGMCSPSGRPLTRDGTMTRPSVSQMRVAL